MQSGSHSIYSTDLLYKTIAVIKRFTHKFHATYYILIPYNILSSLSGARLESWTIKVIH